MVPDKRWLGVALLLIGALLPLSGQTTGSGPVYVVPITGTIELGLAPFVERSVHEAEEAGAAAELLDIDTPGGRVDAAERIADAVAASDVPVYAFVNRQAYSAGALIALATDGIYMPPGGVMGAATPVEGGRVRLVPGEHPGLAGPRGFLRIQPVGMADPVLVLAREGDGYDAVSPVCTHKECIVNAEGGLLVCPCHGSTYDREGAVLEGPAERPLRRFRTRTEEGVLVIDLTESV